ncbi:MAG: hypothetical protein PQJ48_11950 [Sphaerochaetaceae bacterium]|nr:hypothetical protein [Sphaerochaetaceae bacterium]
MLNEKDKIKKINSLKDEVHDFHPFLNGFLKKLPNIQKVEYTHGSNEFGADFILSKKDETLGQIRYIGVIAKTTPIKQDDVEKLDKQVTETFKIPKLVEGGKEKILPKTAWIITSQNITHNAAVKINEYFVGRDVQIIDDSSIVTYIDKHYSEYWSNISFALSTYMSKIRGRLEEEEKRFNLVSTLDASFYIKPEIVRINETNNEYSDNNSKPLIEIVDIDQFIEKEKFVVVEAPMGYGKSKLFRELTKQYISPSVYEKKNIIAVPLKYSELFSNDLFKPEILNQICCIDSQEIENHKRIIFLIDGFDEKDEPIDAKFRNVKILEHYISKYQNFSIVLATRGMKGFSEKSFDNEIIRKVTIQGLSTKKIIEFLIHICKGLNLTDRLIQDIKRTPLIKDLPQSPLATILLAKLFESNSKDLPANLPELYSSYMELVLGKWDKDKGIESFRDYEISLNILYNLAEFFIDMHSDNMPFETYRATISDYLSSRNLHSSFSAIDTIITERSGILRKNAYSDTVTYTHRSFIEYLYAKSKVSSGKELEVSNRVFNLSWFNIYYFYIGIKKDCYEYLEKISAVRPETENERWMKVINLSNLYLAAISTPYRFFENNLYKVFIEVSDFYIDTIQKGSSMIFSKLPRVIVLWWVQFIVKENYSYLHFKKAIVDSTIHIDDSKIDENIKMYSLFFIGLVGAELDEFEPFRYLLGKYKERLPDDITIGLQAELKTEEIADKQILGAQKWIKRKVRKIDPMLRKQLLDTPVERVIKETKRKQLKTK